MARVGANTKQRTKKKGKTRVLCPRCEISEPNANSVRTILTGVSSDPNQPKRNEPA